ncbi:MAG: tRNA intron endonuclease [Candidatus Bathyarchaeota archaeon B63]|nr:MAG: tRNA intron endonuclease [Candidatus Bathyarchaeota archaeon B63]
MEKRKEGNEKPGKSDEKVLIRGVLREDGVLVPPTEDIEGLTSRGYGTPKNGDLLLAFHEALYLLSKGILEVRDEGTNEALRFEDLLERARLHDDDAWVKYLIYRDLRSRGYFVREGFGFGADFRVYKRGEYGKSPAAYLVLGVREGQPIMVEELLRILTRVQSLKKNFILSVINRRGEIVYYSVSRLSLG